MKVELAVKRFLFSKLEWLFKKWYGEHPYPVLEKKHIEGCELLLDRKAFLNALPKAARCAEIGVERGIFAKQILEICKPQHLDLADWWLNKQQFEETKARLIEHKNLTYYQSTSLEYLKSKPQKSLDWVYIDTDHTYKTTKEELELARIAVVDNGLICGHDYTSVSYSGLKKYGVVEAVNEFCLKYDYKFVYLTHETSRYISFAITKITS
jgi:hypothetical protein